MYGQYISTTVKIKCRDRTCKLVLMRKNYKDHLIKTHPREDPHDLTPFGQNRISDFVQKKPLQSSDSSRLDENSNPDLDITTEALELPASLGKQNEPSGDSVDSEIGAEKQKPEENSKLEEILSEIRQLNKKFDDRFDYRANAIVEKAYETNKPDNLEIAQRIQLARSIEDLEKLGFKYNGSIISCSVCDPDGDQVAGLFTYDEELGVQFEDEFMLPREFVNLKASLKRHLGRKTHMEVVKANDEKEKEAIKMQSKNHKAGINLCNVCMKNFKLGRPYTDYEVDVLLLEKSGAVVGEPNHSRMFPPAFRPCVSKAVTERVSNFLSSPLLMTGHPPPLASADKATYKHRSRQFFSAVTVNPGGENFLEIISCGQPVVTEGSSGAQLAKNMKEGFDKYKINSFQIESCVLDEVYFHCSIEKHFDEIYNLEPGSVLYSWDGLHKSGLVDTHLGKQTQFAWLSTITDICVRVFKLFNWGANYERLVEATSLWKMKLLNLVTFCDTRFANSRRKVYLNIHHQLAPIMTCLNNFIEAAERNRVNLEASNSKAREKGDSAKELKGKILNVHFLLLLSGLADVYDQYGVVVNVAQKVHLLPHQRLDQFNQAVSVFKDMLECLEDHSMCAKFFNSSRKGKCLWPLNRMDKRTLEEESQIMGLDIIELQV